MGPSWPPSPCKTSGSRSGSWSGPKGSQSCPNPMVGCSCCCSLRGYRKGGMDVGATHLLALDARQPGEPCFTLRTPRAVTHQHPHSPGEPGNPSNMEWGGLSPLYSLVALVLVHPGAPRWNPAAVQRGHGHRRTGRSPPARAGRGQGSGGAWGCTPSKQVGQRDRHSPSPLSSLGCQHLPGEEKEEQGWVLLGQAGCHSVSPQL